MTPLARIDLICEQEELYTRQEIVTTIRKIVAEGMRDVAQAAPLPDLERFCIAFTWAYGSALERRHYPGEPEDGHTPESLWAEAPEEEREFMRGVVRDTFSALGSGGIAYPPNVRYEAGIAFKQHVNGPDVALHTVFPVIEYGTGTLRVRALAVSEEAQREIVAALSSVPSTRRAPGPMVPWELDCKQEVCAAPECECPALSSTPRATGEG